MRGYATSFCVLSLLGTCTLAMDESSPSSSLQSSSSGSVASNSNSVPAGLVASSTLVSGLSHSPRAGLVYNVPIGSSSSSSGGTAAFLQIPAKRAFTYRTEFKRLPLYQFGLGKRSRTYAFGLGKRGKQYAFGLGKRSQGNGNAMSEYEQQLQQRLRPDQMQAALDYLSSNEDAYDRSDSSLGQSDYWLDKRSAGSYNFGLGKRSPGSYNYDPEEQQQRLMLPVKQLRNNKYVFGLGKRRLYDLVDNSGSSSGSDSDDVEDLELELSDDEANSQ